MPINLSIVLTFFSIRFWMSTFLRQSELSFTVLRDKDLVSFFFMQLSSLVSTIFQRYCLFSNTYCDRLSKAKYQVSLGRSVGLHVNLSVYFIVNGSHVKLFPYYISEIFYLFIYFGNILLIFKSIVHEIYLLLFQYIYFIVRIYKEHEGSVYMKFVTYYT